MNKQQGSTLSTTTNGSRSYYISTKKYAFLSVGTILARTKDISNNLLNWFWALFRNINAFAKRPERGSCWIFKRNIAHLSHGRPLRTLITASAERLKSLFVQAKFTGTFCIWTIHVPNENNSAVVVPTIRGECAAHRNCSQWFHTCLQRNIGSCRDGEFRDG